MLNAFSEIRLVLVHTANSATVHFIKKVIQVTSSVTFVIGLFLMQTFILKRAHSYNYRSYMWSQYIQTVIRHNWQNGN